MDAGQSHDLSPTAVDEISGWCVEAMRDAHRHMADAESAFTPAQLASGTVSLVFDTTPLLAELIGKITDSHQLAGMEVAASFYAYMAGKFADAAAGLPLLDGQQNRRVTLIFEDENGETVGADEVDLTPRLVGQFFAAIAARDSGTAHALWLACIEQGPQETLEFLGELFVFALRTQQHLRHLRKPRGEPGAN
jgi:hypothetical protein